MFCKKIWSLGCALSCLLSVIHAEDRQDFSTSFKITPVDFKALLPEESAGLLDLIKESPTVERFFGGKEIIAAIQVLIPQKALSLYNNLFEGFKAKAPEGYGVNDHYLVRDKNDIHKIVGWFHIHSNPDPMPSPYEEDGKKWILSTRVFSSTMPKEVEGELEKKFLKALSLQDTFANRTFLLETYKESEGGKVLADVLKGELIGETIIERNIIPALRLIQHKNIQAYKINPAHLED